MKTVSVLLPCDSTQLINLLESKLRDGVVTFAYKKKSTEELRIARGTLNPNLFEYHYKGKKRKKPKDCVLYWDIDKGNWRMLKTYNLIQVI